MSKKKSVLDLDKWPWPNKWSNTYVSGHNQSVLHQVDPGRDRADVVEWVRRLQELVLGVVHDGGGEGVETHKVCDRTVPLKKK